MNSTTYYEILEGSPTSSYEDLKRSYRKLILQHHPDKVDDTLEVKTADKFNQIEEAWKILRNPVSRKKYDAECRQAVLDSQSILVHTTITADEMEVTVDDDTFSYKCRCGSYYLANRLQLLPKNSSIQIPCEECTFVIVVQT